MSYIYMIQKTMQSILCHIISLQYHWNVSVNLQWIYIDTNSILLGSLSSPTVTLREMTSEIICKSAIIADGTPGRQQLWKKQYIEYMCVKYPCVNM